MCIFCRILSDRAPASFVYRDDRVSAFLDIQPVTPGHTLVIPNAHCETLADVSREDWGHLLTVARHLAGVLRTSDVRCDGVNVFVADGEVAGQEVPHVHVHVIPRFRGDGFGLRLPPDYGVPPQRGDLDRLAAKLREAVNADDLAP